IGVPLSVTPQGGNYRNDVVLQERLEQADIDTLDATRELMIDSLKDAGRMGHEGVAARSPQVVRGEAFENFVGDAIGGGQGELERRAVGHSGAVDVGRRLPGLLGEATNLMAGAVDQGDFNAQAAQQENIEQQVAEVVVLDNGAVQGDYEDLVPVLRHI